MKITGSKQKKSKKSSRKLSNLSEQSNLSTIIQNSSFESSLESLENYIKDKLKNRNTQKTEKNEKNLYKKSMLIDSSPEKIVLSKDYYFLYEGMENDSDNSQILGIKEISSLFKLSVNPSQNFCNKIEANNINLHQSDFNLDFDNFNQVITLTKLFFDKKIKPVEKLSFGKSPEDLLKVAILEKDDNNVKILDIKTEMHNMPIFEAKDYILHETTKESEICTSENCSASSTNPPVANDKSNIILNDSDADLNTPKSGNDSFKKISVEARKRLCEKYLIDYRNLMSSKEGKNKIKKLIREKNKEYKAFKNEIRNEMIKDNI